MNSTACEDLNVTHTHTHTEAFSLRKNPLPKENPPSPFSRWNTEVGGHKGQSSWVGNPKRQRGGGSMPQTGSRSQLENFHGVRVEFPAGSSRCFPLSRLGNRTAGFSSPTAGTHTSKKEEGCFLSQHEGFFLVKFSNFIN